MVPMALRSLRVWRSLVVVLLFATHAEAGSLTLAWDPSPNTDVAGYMVAYGSQSRNYSTRIDASNVSRLGLAWYATMLLVSLPGAPAFAVGNRARAEHGEPADASDRADVGT